MAGGLNTYAYASANPIGNIDPFGLDSLRFDGNALTRFDDKGKPIRSWPAISGVPGSTPADSYISDIGPIPEGQYSLDPSKSNYDSWWKPGWGDPSAWGNVRTLIEPLPGTYTGGRYEMYVHGGSAPGSTGCIDLTSSNDDFHNWLKQQSESIPLTVDYPGYQSPYVP